MLAKKLIFQIKVVMKKIMKRVKVIKHKKRERTKKIIIINLTIQDTLRMKKSSLNIGSLQIQIAKVIIKYKYG